MADPFDIDITDIDMSESVAAKEQHTKDELEMFTKEELEGVSKVSEEVRNEICCVEIHSPKELWALGAVKLIAQVDDGSKAVDVVAAAQEIWADLREEFADELEAATARENAMTPAQRNKIEELVEEAGDELPEGFDEFSKSQASKVIQEAITENQANRKSSTSHRQNRSSSRSSNRSSGRRNSSQNTRSRRSRSSGRRSNRGGGEGDFSNLQGEISSAQVRLIGNICDDLDIEPEAGYKAMSKQEASDYIKELQEKRDS